MNRELARMVGEANTLAFLLIVAAGAGWGYELSGEFQGLVIGLVVGLAVGIVLCGVLSLVIMIEHNLRFIADSLRPVMNTPAETPSVAVAPPVNPAPPVISADRMAAVVRR